MGGYISPAAVPVTHSAAQSFPAPLCSAAGRLSCGATGVDDFAQPTDSPERHLDLKHSYSTGGVNGFPFHELLPCSNLIRVMSVRTRPSGFQVLPGFQLCVVTGDEMKLSEAYVTSSELYPI